MPIPLGILAAAGIRPAGAAGAYELLETVLISSNTNTVTFSNLATAYSSTYQHLQFRITARDSRATTGGNNVNTRVNGDTGNNYAWRRLTGDGSSVVSASAAPSVNLINLFSSASANDASGIFGAAIIDILDPFEISKNTTFRSIQGTPTGSTPAISLRSAVWLNTSAVSSISFWPNTTGDFVAGTRFSLYGLKASA